MNVHAALHHVARRIAAVALPSLIVASVASAQGRSENLVPSDGTVLRVDRPVTTVLVADPEVANVQLVSNRTVFIFGKTVGRTRVILLGADDRPIEEISVVVSNPRPPVLVGR